MKEDGKTNMKKLLLLGVMSASVLVSCTQPEAANTSEQTLQTTTSVALEEKSTKQTTTEHLTESMTAERYEYIFADADNIASEEIIKEIKDRIAAIDFSIQEFSVNDELYDLELDKDYKQAYFKAITNQIQVKEFDYPEKETYYKQLLRGEELPEMSDEEFLEILKKCNYHYIDYDGDGLPELVIHLNGPVILKYAPEEKQVYLLGSYDRSRLLGSSQMYYYNSDAANRRYYSYWSRDKEGNETSFSFDIEATGRNGEWFYEYCLISIDEFEQVNVGKENWDEITEDFMAFIQLADELALPYITFTEIFGDGIIK